MNGNNKSVTAIHGSNIALSNTKEVMVNTEEDQFDEINISDLIKVLKRHKLLIFAITSLIFLLSLLFTLSVVPTYQAEATLKIDREADKIVSYDVIEQKAIDQNFYQTQFDVLKSRSLATRVIEDIGLEDYFDQPQIKKPFIAEQLDDLKILLQDKMDELIALFNKNIMPFFTGKDTEQDIVNNTDDGDVTPADDELFDDTIDEADNSLAEKPVELEFLSHLTVKPSKRSNIVHILYEATDPELAARIINSVGENYIKMNIESRGNSTVYAKEFLNEQLALAKSKLQKSEEELVAYAKRKKIVNTDDNHSIISSELLSLSQAYTDAKTKLISAESEYRQKNKVSGSIRLMDNKVIQSLKEKLSSLEIKYSELSQIYKPGYPAMREINKQIIALKQQINKEKSIIHRGSSDELKSTYLAAKQNAANLKAQLDKKKAEIMKLRDKSIGYQVLKREVETNRELYNGLLQRVKEVGVAGGVVSNNVSFLDRSFVPYKKYKPNTTRNLAIGLLLGLMMGIGLAFLLETMDDTIKSVDDIETLVNLPVIGFFPFIKTKRSKNPLLIHDKPFSATSEAFRSLAVDLEYSTEQGTPKILHVTSSASNEGKSCSVINLSTVVAQEGKRVVIIDCDLRKPSLHSYLDMRNERGLTDVLVGKYPLTEALQPTEIPDLSLLPAGVLPSNPVKLLASQSMMDLLDNLSDQFDLVVIDSPPVMGMADALILSNRATATLFVSASNESKKAAITDSIKRLKRSYGNIIGVFLTKVKTGNGHYYYYDHYYSYGNNDAVGIEMEPIRRSA